MNWNIDVPMLRNSTILKQLFYCLGVPFILLGTIISLSARDWADSLEIAIVFGWILLGLAVTAVLIILIFLGGKNKLSFSMDSNGVYSETRAEQAKKGKIIGILAVIVGLLARKPTVIGTGMLVGARGAVESIGWKNVMDIKYKQGSHTIVLKESIFHRLYVFCLPENYAEATEYIKERMLEQQAKQEKKAKKQNKASVDKEKEDA